MTEDICLLRRTMGEKTPSISFGHQNYRDFLAAVYITSENEDESKRDALLAENLQEFILPFEIRRFVGELLSEHRYAKNGDSTLLELLKNKAEGHTVHNIAEIHKALGLLESTLDYFVTVDFSKINFKDIDKDKVLLFVKKILQKTQTSRLITELVGKIAHCGEMDSSTLRSIERALRISIKAATDAKPEVSKQFFQTWQDWFIMVYGLKPEIIYCILSANIKRSTKQQDRLTKVVEDALRPNKSGLLFKLVTKKKFITFLDKVIAEKAAAQITQATNKANIFQKQGDILNIFEQVAKKKDHLGQLTDLLVEHPKLHPVLVDSLYEIAKWNSLVSNYVILVICHCLICDLEEGFKLVELLYEKTRHEQDPEVKALVQWKIYSSLNFTVQESKFKNSQHAQYHNQFEENKDFYYSRFKPLMNSITKEIVSSFLRGEWADRKYGFAYYFPLGVLSEFDTTLGDQFTRKLIMDTVFVSSGMENIRLLQRFIFEIACLSANSFHTQFEEYKEQAYFTLTEVVEQILICFRKLAPAEKKAVTQSLTEMFAILSYIDPVKTAAQFGELVRTHSNNTLLLQMSEILEDQKQNAFSKLLAYENMEAVNTNKYFISDLFQKKKSVRDHIDNCKNTWLFSDLGVNMLTQIAEARDFVSEKVLRDLMANSDVYQKTPQKFFSSLLLQVFTNLNNKADLEYGGNPTWGRDVC